MAHVAIDLFEKTHNHDRAEQLRVARENDLLPYFRLTDGEPVGRITAMVDRQFNDYHDWKWGAFGFFE